MGQVHFSPQWARLLGYEPDEIPQRVEFFFTVLHPEDIQRVQNVLEDHLAGQLVDHRKDGKPFWSEQTLTPVRDEQGRLSHFISIIRAGEF